MKKQVNYKANINGTTFRVIAYYKADGTFQGADVTIANSLVIFSSTSLESARKYLRDEATKKLHEDL